MKIKTPDFSMEQWRFLAVLDAFGTSVPIHLVGHLESLPPGPLFDVISKSKKSGWLIQKGEDNFALGKNLPKEVRKKLSTINTPDYLSMIVNRLQDLKLEAKTELKLIVRLMEKGGLEKEASKLDLKIAENALKSENYENAWTHFKHAADRLNGLIDDADCKAWFIPTVLSLSNLSFILGKGLNQLDRYLHQGQKIAEELGDTRSHSMVNLHLGRLYYFSDRRSDALVALSVGLNEIEELGDEDILDQSAVFLGLLFFLQGQFKEALEHLERAERIYEARGKGQLIDPITPILLGSCLTNLGEFHRAIGSLDCHWRGAKERSDHTLAVTLRAMLAIVLLLSKRDKEATFHIEGAAEETADKKNALALLAVRGSIALKHMLAGKVVEAHEELTRLYSESAATGLARQYASPWILEMIYEFDRQGLEPIPGLSFQQAMMRAIEENNIHLHGVALRLEAHKKLSENKPIASIMANLSKSREYLEKSGDILQLSKTLIEIARLELTKGKKKQARKQVQEAWKVLGGYADDFFPDDLRYLLDPENHRKDWHETPQDSFQHYIELTEGIFPIHNQDEILSRAVMATNRFFRAERGGLFWFPGGKPTKKPELRASSNLTASDVSAENFKPNHALILKAFRENRPILERKVPIRPNPAGNSVRAVLCLPVEIRGKIRAVICHDNSYLEDCFDFLDPFTIRKVVNHVSRQVARAYEYFRMREERNDLIVEKSIHEDSFGQKELIYQSQIMAELILQVDKVARSDSTVLILGETGVGKELMARRVHEMSPRRNKGYIVVDATTIPEGLIESELFGHEKGAFTGADRQKKGRMELAHHGTLFIDEIGEFPKSIQAKLLRAIQERSFFRVGGTRTLHSDFRLIAATNRDLAEEVAAKRFRPDLYYRLSVIPFLVPALRDRSEDVLLLANHFLRYYTKKYHRHDLAIDPETELSLKQYDWTGNVRELKNIIERAALLSSGGRLEIDLPLNRLKGAPQSFTDTPTLEELEKRYIQYILKKTGGKRSGPGSACEILGLKRSTLYSRMKKLGMH